MIQVTSININGILMCLKIPAIDQFIQFYIDV